MAGKRHPVLFVINLPPPVHGVSVMNNLIRSSAFINEQVQGRYIDLTTAGSVEDLQKYRSTKYAATAVIFLKVFVALVVRRYRNVYITPFPYGPAFVKDAAVILLCRFFGYRPILHLHTRGFRAAASRSERRRSIYRFIFRKTRVVMVSSNVTEDVGGLYEGSITILPNALPLTNSHNPYQIRHGVPRILFLSNLVKGKGVRLLIEAAQLLREQGMQFRLVIAGAEFDVTYGEIRSDVERRGLADITDLEGAVDDRRKKELLLESDVFVLPTDYDTFGVVLLEAMQYGLPCVSTRVGGIPELLGEGRGELIETIAAGPLSLAIAGLLRDPARRKQMSDAAYHHFVHNYTFSMFEKRFVELLEKPAETVSLQTINCKR